MAVIAGSLQNLYDARKEALIVKLTKQQIKALEASSPRDQKSK
jgi:hypothetical protein